MKKVSVLTLIFIFLFILAAMAELSLKAEVDKKSITTDDNLTYKLIIASEEKNIPQPQVPTFAGFQVLSRAQSSTISFIKGGVKTILVYAFILAPTDVGTFEIEPSTIKIKDKTYSTDTFEIEVTKGKHPLKAMPEKKPSLQQEIPSQSEEPQYTL